MEQLKVKDLYKLLEKEIKKGNGDKLLITADDMEGNGYHGIWFGITEGKEICDGDNTKYQPILVDSQTQDWNEVVCIG